MQDFDRGAAKVDVVECTMVPQHYDYPGNPNIKFWDLPGITSPTYEGDLEKYCKNVPLEKYDTYLIFGRDRFTAHDLKLAEKIRSIGKKFFFIRGKIDQDVESAQRSEQHLFDKDATMDKIRKILSKNLIERGLLKDEREIFLVSNHFPTEYQFDELTQAIVAVLPERQRESLLLTIDNTLSLSKNTLKGKVEVLKKRIKYVATASAFAAVIPFPGASIAADIVLITREINFYKSQLGLPDEGSDKFSLLSLNTQSEIKVLLITLGGAAKIVALVAAYAAENIVEEFARFIPLIGTAIAGPLSYATTYYFLLKWLEKLEEIALKVLVETLVNVKSH